MTNTIKHAGVIESINNESIKVKIIQTAACSSCSAKGFCSSSESKEKSIDIPYSKNTSLEYQIGDQVEIIGETSMGVKAVLLAFVVPFVVVIVLLFALMGMIENESYAALAALAGLIPYYFLLWYFRDKIKDKFIFKIKPIK